MKLEKIRIFILQFFLENPRPNQKLFFKILISRQLPDNKRLALASQNEIRRDGGTFSRQ